jgi:hypothetical protein
LFALRAEMIHVIRPRSVKVTWKIRPFDVGEHVIAGFAVVFARIPCNFPSGVRKTHDNIGEVDTALNDVLRAFGRVPVELHDSM